MRRITNAICHCDERSMVHDVATATCRRGDPVHRFAVAAVQRERHSAVRRCHSGTRTRQNAIADCCVPYRLSHRSRGRDSPTINRAFTP